MATDKVASVHSRVDDPAPMPARELVIRARNLRKVYRLGGDVAVHALRGLDLDVVTGEYAAIMGPSGSGKSTLLQILGCLDVPSDGSYLLSGDEVATLDEEGLSTIRNRRIGFVFQAYNLLPRANALDNVALPLLYRGIGLRARRERAREALERVGLADRMDHRPNELSGGQKQRVAIARALAADPDILLADEPTGNLDSQTGQEILTLFDVLHGEGRTILIVTHEAEVAEHCERIIRIRDGVVESSEHVTTRRRPPSNGDTGA